jgi:hypothetical protein
VPPAYSRRTSTRARHAGRHRPGTADARPTRLPGRTIHSSACLGVSRMMERTGRAWCDATPACASARSSRIPSCSAGRCGGSRVARNPRARSGSGLAGWTGAAPAGPRFMDHPPGRRAASVR